MKQAVVDAREFEMALKTAAAAVMRRSSIAMLEQVCLSVSDGVCRLTGTVITDGGDSYAFILTRRRRERAAA